MYIIGLAETSYKRAWASGLHTSGMRASLFDILCAKKLKQKSIRIQLVAPVFPTKEPDHAPVHRL